MTSRGASSARKWLLESASHGNRSLEKMRRGKAAKSWGKKENSCGMVFVPESYYLYNKLFDWVPLQLSLWPLDFYTLEVCEVVTGSFCHDTGSGRSICSRKSAKTNGMPPTTRCVKGLRATSSYSMIFNVFPILQPQEMPLPLMKNKGGLSRDLHASSTLPATFAILKNAKAARCSCITQTWKQLPHCPILQGCIVPMSISQLLPTKMLWSTIGLHHIHQHPSLICLLA